MPEQIHPHRPKGHKGASAARTQEVQEPFLPLVRKRASGGPDRNDELELVIEEVLKANATDYREALGHLGTTAS